MVLTDRIVERNITDCCPPIKAPKNLAVAKTGFPQPPIVANNREHSDTQLSDSLNIRASDFAKLDWTNPVSEEEEQISSSSDRYDFEGRKIETEDSYTPELYHHGADPGRPGYTLAELFHLTQSGFASQKSIAISTIGKISKNSNRRELHRILIGEWKAHIRFSVACSDTSTNVRSAAWGSLLSLIENLDLACGCIADDLATIFEFFRSLDSENESSVKVMAYIAHVVETKEDEDDAGEFKEAFVSLVQEACEKNKLDFESFKCGLDEYNIRNQLVAESSSPAEIFACICDRIACVSTDPLSKEDVEFLESVLLKQVASLPFFTPGQVDEFAWTSRSSLVVQALMEGAGGPASSFIAKICFHFTSALFPLECRASIWCDLDVLDMIGRSCDSSFRVFGNHEMIDFTCRDAVDNFSRDSAAVVRAIRNGCTKYLGSDCCGNEVIRDTASKIVGVLDSL